MKTLRKQAIKDAFRQFWKVLDSDVDRMVPGLTEHFIR